MIRFYRLFILITILFVISACSASEKEVVSETKSEVENVFLTGNQKANKEKETFRYYMPSSFSVVEQDDYNIVFSKGKTKVILFVNPNESYDSEVLYEQIASEQKVIIDETWNEDGRFAYLKINSIGEKDKHELVIGIGGAKLTTETSTSSMVSTATAMMEIAKSIEIIE
ncbi:hypothetical protein [Bacillus solimangrovi]|uniref:DUF4367 domain-containing protein n=1 Tax=Bacillus solimangrovi TaxID=1305675 RepID=A0A1E5LCG9_9BACI|nr:hypothetical protein [Bacillus solimangrovi]OEH91780.1 hypothetical protein BFG57_03300 [Bacillus solimangrovi]